LKLSAVYPASSRIYTRIREQTHEKPFRKRVLPETSSEGPRQARARAEAGTHLVVNAGAAEFVLDDHNDDAEHAHDEGIVADALALLEQGLPPAQPVADVRLVLGPGPDAAPPGLTLLGATAAGQHPLVHVTGILGVDAHEGDAGVFATPGAAATGGRTGCPRAAPAGPAAVFHRPRDRESRHWLPQLEQREGGRLDFLCASLARTTSTTSAALRELPRKVFSRIWV